MWRCGVARIAFVEQRTLVIGGLPERTDAAGDARAGRHDGSGRRPPKGPTGADRGLPRATGADRGIHLQAEADLLERLDSLALARLIADRLRTESFDLILAGQQSEDLETGQVGPPVAALLDPSGPEAVTVED